MDKVFNFFKKTYLILCNAIAWLIGSLLILGFIWSIDGYPKLSILLVDVIPVLIILAVIFLIFAYSESHKKF
jgi:hypothetical protein